MMKKVLPLFILIVSFNLGAIAQITFSKDTATLELVDGVLNKAKIVLTNNSGHDIDLRWSLITTTLNDNTSGTYPNTVSWKLQFCECITCYLNDFGVLPTGAQCPDPMPTGTNEDWYLTADPNGQTVTQGMWIIEVQNTTDNIKDTLVYIAEAPNSVKNVTYNANVSSYPNPANNELVVDYQLKNVSAPVLNVYSIIGGKVATYELNQANGLLSVNTADFENGMYFFTIEEKGQRVFIQKFNVVH
jgi:hypothetical protein